MENRIDPGHHERRGTLSTLGRFLAVGGGMLTVGGFVAFVFGPATAILSLFRDGGSLPEAGTGLLAAGLGLIALAFGPILLIVGLGLWLFSNLGRIQRFTAAQSIAVQADVLREATPMMSDAIRESTKAAREGWEQGAPPRQR